MVGNRDRKSARATRVRGCAAAPAPMVCAGPLWEGWVRWPHGPSHAHVWRVGGCDAAAAPAVCAGPLYQGWGRKQDSLLQAPSLRQQEASAGPRSFPRPLGTIGYPRLHMGSPLITFRCQKSGHLLFLWCRLFGKSYLAAASPPHRGGWATPRNEAAPIVESA